MSLYYPNSEEQRILSDALIKSNELIDEGFKTMGNMVITREVWDALQEKVEQQEQRIRELELALTAISLCAQNSMSSKHECGVIARKALEPPR